MTTEGIDNHLNEVCMAQLTFKPSKIRPIMVAVVRALLSGIQWTDEWTLPDLDAKSRNCIGGAVKVLSGRGIIKRCEGATDHRRSKRDSRRGGVAWRYVLPSDKLANTFLRANKDAEPQQPEPQPDARQAKEQLSLI